jgi:hypothetical protein
MPSAQGRNDRSREALAVTGDMPNGTSLADSVWHYADFFLHFRRVYHRDRIPGTAVQERAIRTLAGAFLAADTQNRVHLYAAKWWMVLIRDPKHAVFYRAILDASRRAGASGTTLGNNSQLFWLFLADGSNALGTRFALEFVRDHPGLFFLGFGSHRRRLYRMSQVMVMPENGRPQGNKAPDPYDASASVSLVS